MDECATCGHSQFDHSAKVGASTTYHWCDTGTCPCPEFRMQDSQDSKPKSLFRKRRIDYCANCGISWLAHPQAMEDPEAISSGCTNFLSEAVANA